MEIVGTHDFHFEGWLMGEVVVRIVIEIYRYL